MSADTFTRRNTGRLLLLCAALGLCTPASAQQLKPYFLVIVDTSGSMGWCAAGTVPDGSNDCSCHTTANNCSSAFRLNRCGFPSNKLGDAKCALQRILDGTGGDAVFGLMQYEHPCSDTCAPTDSACGSSCSASPACDDAQLAVAIESGNANVMREWVDGQCQGSCSGANNFRHELSTGQWTPIAKSLQRANEYLRGPGAVSGNPWASTDPNSELNITGSSPIGSPLDGDPQLACRPVSVIMLTDGEDNCAGSVDVARNAAATLFAGDPKASTPAGKSIRTYVIGFGASGGNFNPTELTNIAKNGGTDQYFPAMNEADLSLALGKIIADAQPPAEKCNNADDDCDGRIDEGLPKYCNKPMGIDDRVLCDEPMETNCDKEDDDCDGLIDEGLTNACGECGDVPKEVCDNVDNDCDSRIDENTSNGEECGKNTGECKAGQLVCTDGAEQCTGQIGEHPELCDCKDNDCDGTIDEDGTDPLCPSGQRCAGCHCVEFCQQTTEFAATCVAGLTPSFQPNGECLCVTDTCDYAECTKSTIESSGEVACAPNDPKVAPCICQAGSCVSRCTGVTCDSGEICDPKKGACVEDSCRSFGCSDDRLCDPMSGKCVDDRCAKAPCKDDQVCRNGQCEPSCANARCRDDQTCSAGTCYDDPCWGTKCDNGKVCDRDTGSCVDDKCAGHACRSGQVCALSSGDCEADPCWNVKCPGEQKCQAGQCRLADQIYTQTATLRNAVGEATQLLATGGGGCACSTPGGTGGGPNLPRDPRDALGLAGAAVLWLARRRWRRMTAHARWQWARRIGISCVVLAGVSLGACRVTPLCINCVDAAVKSPDAATGMMGDSVYAGGAGGSNGREDAGPRDAGDDASDAAESQPEAGMPNRPTCTPTGKESCNNKDDDCDFKVDEDVMPTTNTCAQAGVCAGTVPLCVNGKFVCRFGNKYEMDETSCDGLDNDCDGKVDESFDMLGHACEVGVGACKAVGKLKCNTSGKGLSCDAAPTQGSEEVCNGVDDDCDGVADEPHDNPGSNPSYVHDDVVQVGSALWIYKYEASRVDATDKNEGIVGARACSRAGVLPWTNVTYTEAVAACESVGMSLCKLDDWMGACKGDAGCTWSAASCSTYANGTCNDHNAATMSGETDTDALLPTGSKSDCYTDFSSAGRVYDLSGNAKEWTQGPDSPGKNPLRGGSYNNASMGLTCDFDFTLGAAELRLPNVGFRCCSAQAP